MREILDIKDRPECQTPGPTTGLDGALRYCHHIERYYRRLPPVVVNLVTMEQVWPDAKVEDYLNQHNKTITFAYLLPPGIYRTYVHSTGEDGEESLIWTTILINKDIKKLAIDKTKPSIVEAIVALCAQIARGEK